MRTRPVSREKAEDYLKRARECMNSMSRSFDEGEWNASVINSVHCAIASADALSIWIKGIRHAGERHDDAVRLFLDVDPHSAEIQKASRRLQSLLRIKTDSEYGERLMTEREAALAKKDAERLFLFVRDRVPP